MKQIFVIFVFAFISTSYAENSKKWYEKNAEQLTAIFAEASKKDGEHGLTQSELEIVIGKPDYEENNDLVIPDKKVWTLKNGKSESKKTQEFVWKLSGERRLQIVVTNSHVVYAFVVNRNKQKELVWK